MEPCPWRGTGPSWPHTLMIAELGDGSPLLSSPAVMNYYFLSWADGELVGQ